MKAKFKYSCLVITLLLLAGQVASSQEQWGPDDSVFPGKHTGEFYDRLAKDLKEGKPMVVTAYVALCDNDSQGILPTRNPKICMGDYPEQNLYWASSGGLKGHMRTQRWKRVLYKKSITNKIAVTGIWKKKILTGRELRKRGVKKTITVYVVGLGYRGTKIHDAMVDYLHAVSTDKVDTITTKNGVTIEYGGASHIVGYIGHDYFMDVWDSKVLFDAAKGDGTTHKGVFGLACVSDSFFRPAIQRRNAHIFALNTALTYPSAFTVLGIVRGVVAGKDLKGIHKEAARAFAKGQKKSVRTMLRALANGDKP